MVSGPAPAAALDVSGLDRARAVAARLAYKPGYALVVQDSRPDGGGAIAIETDAMIPNAEVGPAAPPLTPDTWEDPAVGQDLTRLDGAAVAFLSAAINCAVHEVLEWFSVDGRRLVDAHAGAVANHVEKVAEQLAAWCWRNRQKSPGKPRPV
jgi:hypothetical protein